MAKRILIIGATGFAGSHLAELLIAQSESDTQIFGTYYKDDLPEVRDLLPTVTFSALNITDAQAVSQLVQDIQPSEIYNLSGIANVAVDQADLVHQVNCQGALNILNATQEFVPQTKVLLVSSAYVYGSCSLEKPALENDPLVGEGMYAESKIAMEQSSERYTDLHIMIARPFNHIGARQPLGFIVADVAKQIAELELQGGGAIQVGSLESYRDFLDVRDTVAGYIAIMEHGSAHDIYNICGDTPYTTQYVVEQLVELANTPITIEVSVASSPAKVAVLAGNASKLKALGWKSHYTLQDALSAALEYWRTHATTRN